MTNKDADELVLDMTSERCLLATENLINDNYMQDDKVVVVLKLFAKACSSETTQSSLHKLLSMLPKSTFLSLHLSSYINRMTDVSLDLEVDEKQNQIALMIKILKELLVMLPSSFADLPIAQLHLAVMNLDSKGELIDKQIKSEVEDLVALKDEMAEKVKQEGEAGTSRKPRRINRREEGKETLELREQCLSYIS